MISLEMTETAANAPVFESWDHIMPLLFTEKRPDVSRRMVRYNSKPAGLAAFRCEDGIVHLDFWLAPDTDDRKKILACVTENMVRRFHPEQIVIDNPFQELLDVYRANSYIQSGGCICKPVEMWRRILKDQVFDEEGYIINQGLMKDIPFGWFDTESRGCGWIAAFNLLKMNGMEVPMETCAHNLEKNAVLGKLMGQNVFPLIRWLKKQGLDVHVSAPFNKSAVKMVRSSKSGIILYNHTKGAHYTTYRYLGDSKVQLYNARYGRRNHVISIDEFMYSFTLFPTSIVICVRQ